MKNNSKTRVITFLSYSAFIIAMTMVTGCGKAKLKTVRGLVKNVTTEADTLESMTIQTGEDGDTIVFDVTSAKLNEGIMMPKDSVIVDYANVRHTDTARAYVVTVLPKPVQTIDITKEKNNKLVTKSKKEIDKFEKEQTEEENKKDGIKVKH